MGLIKLSESNLKKIIVQKIRLKILPIQCNIYPPPQQKPKAIQKQQQQTGKDVFSLMRTIGRSLTLHSKHLNSNMLVPSFPSIIGPGFDSQVTEKSKLILIYIHRASLSQCSSVLGIEIPSDVVSGREIKILTLTNHHLALSLTLQIIIWRRAAQCVFQGTQNIENSSKNLYEIITFLTENKKLKIT